MPESPEYKPITIENLHRHTDQFNALNKLPDRLLKKVVYPLLHRILKLDDINGLIEKNFTKQGMEFAQGILNTLNFHVITSEEELKNIPKEGAVIVACNHPRELSDGAIIEALLKVRSDISALGMEFVQALTQNLENNLISVNKMTARTQENKDAIYQKAGEALKAGKLLLIMGSGTGANKKTLGLRGKPIDGPWKTGIARLALEFNVPVVPAHINAENDWWFYVIRAISKKLSMFFYLSQFLKKSGQKFPVRFGKKIVPETIKRWERDIEEQIEDNLHPELDTKEKKENFPFKLITQKIRDRVFALAEK